MNERRELGSGDALHPPTRWAVQEEGARGIGEGDLMDRGDITRILQQSGDQGNVPRSAADEVFATAYAELRALAERTMRNEREDHTLQPTALLNEAYLRLVDHTQLDWRNRAHFFGIAARAMRQVLIEHARRKSTAKRGGPWTRVAVSDEAMLTSQPDLDLVSLDQALTKLAEKSERMAQVVELRVFGGLTGEEIATALGVSRKTVVGDWRVAQMWMRAELTGEEPE